MEKYLSFSLQFSLLSEKQVDQLSAHKDLPKNISTYIQVFDSNLPEKDFNDARFSYRVLVFQKAANRKGQADKVIEFVPPNSEIAKGLSKEYWAIKEREKKKHLPGSICKEMQKIGYIGFKQHLHTELWKKENAKELSKGFGVQVERTWYWYDSWLDFVRQHCEKNKSKYS